MACHCRVFAVRRWTPSQALPSPLDPTSLIRLSDPKPVWDMPLAYVAADRSAVQHMDLGLKKAGVLHVN
jgi:hypothetical protein